MATYPEKRLQVDKFEVSMWEKLKQGLRMRGAL